MAIEFPCSRCGRQLRTSEENIGREAKCPECGSLTVIPAVSGGVQPQAAQFAAAPSNNPFASPAIGGQFAQQPFGAVNPGDIVPARIGISDALGAAWRVFSANLGACIIFSIVMIVFGLIVFGILGFIVTAMLGNPNGPFDPGRNLISQLVTMIPATWLMLGIIRYFIAMSRGEKPGLGTAFSGSPHFARGLAFQFLMFLIGALLNAPLFIIDGGMAFAWIAIAFVANIVVYLFFCQTLALIVDKGLGVSDALSMSMNIMNGNKLTLGLIWVVLFIGGLIFCGITIGLGALAFVPYTLLVYVVFYLLASGQNVAG